MINVGTDVISAFKTDDFKGDFTLTVGEHTYTPHNILSGSASLTESLCSSKNIDFSAVEKSELKLTLINITENISDLIGSKLTLTQTVLNTQIPYGVFNITEALNDGDYLYEITAYDNLQLFDVDVTDWWNNTLKFPTSVKNLLISLCDRVGAQYNFPETFTNSDFQITKNIYVDNATGIDFLRYIQEVIGAFIKPSRTGVMEIRELNINVSLTPHDGLYPYIGLYPHGASSEDSVRITYNVPITMDKLEIADYTVQPIDKLQIRGSENDIGIIVGTGNNAYIIQSNPLLYSFSGADADYDVANTILEKIQSLVYVPCTTKVKAQPYIEVGDVVKFESYEGKIAYGPLLTRTMSGFLFNSDSIEIQGEKFRDEKIQAVNKTTSVLNQKLHEIVNTVEEYRSTISSVTTEIVSDALENYTTKTEVATSIEQSAETIQLSVINAINGDQLNMHFLFDNQGVHIATLDGDGNIVSDYQALFTEQGMRVMDNQGNMTLSAEQDTVDAVNLTAHQYFRIADDSNINSRFQGFQNSIHNKFQFGIFWEK